MQKKVFWFRYILTIQPETKMKIKKVTDVGEMQNTPKFLWSDLRQTLEQHFVPKEEFSYVLTYPEPKIDQFSEFSSEHFWGRKCLKRNKVLWVLNLSQSKLKI